MTPETKKSADRTGAQLANPQHLRDENVADEQRPVRNSVRSVQAVPEREGVVAIAAVPAHEGFDAVAVGDDQSGGEHHLGRVLQMALGDEIFEAVDFADREWPASAPWRIRSRSRPRRSRAGRSSCASRGRCRRRNRSSPRCERRARAAWLVRRAAGTPFRSDASAAPIRAIPWKACRRSIRARDSSARSRSVARSGMRPMNQNSAEMVA